MNLVKQTHRRQLWQEVEAAAAAAVVALAVALGVLLLAAPGKYADQPGDVEQAMIPGAGLLSSAQADNNLKVHG
jgi:hypothetical protein